jgi:hypothetical protein
MSQNWGVSVSSGAERKEVDVRSEPPEDLLDGEKTANGVRAGHFAVRWYEAASRRESTDAQILNFGHFDLNSKTHKLVFFCGSSWR